MTTYIGSLGAMAPTPCVSALGVGTGSRTVLGGGPGTLAPRRARVGGRGPRSWSATLTGDLSVDAAVQGLVDRQARAGGAYRVIPCDAVDHNMLTPQASEDLVGWTGLAQVAYPPVPGVYLLEAWPATLGRAAAGTVVTTPRVPVVRAGTMYLSVHTTGLPTIRAVTRDRDGEVVATRDVTMIRTIDVDTVFTESTVLIDGVGEVPVGDVVFRSAPVTVEVDPMDEATVELQVLPAAGGGDVWVGWPSVAYARTPYTVGRGCDQAVLAMGDRSLGWTWGEGWQDVSYEVLEVGV